MRSFLVSLEPLGRLFANAQSKAIQFHENASGRWKQSRVNGDGRVGPRRCQKHSRPVAVQRVRLAFEHLEQRLCLSGVYELDVIAQTGAGTPFNFNSLGQGPSINDNDYIAFVGESRNSAGELADNIYAYRPMTEQLTPLMNGVFMYPNQGVNESVPGTQAIFGEVQINNTNDVLARRRLNASIQVGFPFGQILTAPLTYLETWNADATNPPGLPKALAATGLPAGASAPLWFFLNPATAGVYPSPLDYWSPFEGLYSASSINNLGQLNFTAIVRNAGNNRISSNVNGDLVGRGGIGDLSIQPMLADNGYYAMTTNDNRVFAEPWGMNGGLQMLAGAANGFTAVGEAGISDDGNLITFAAVSSSTGAGLYACRFDAAAGGYSAPVKILGTSGDGVLDPGETFQDGDGDGTVDAGEDQGGFSSFRLTSRVPVNRSSMNVPDQYTLAFLATEQASGREGLFTVSVDTSDPADATPGTPLTVIYIGDALAGLSGTVAAISLHDSVNNYGTVAFWVSTSAGQQAIVKGSADAEPPFEVLARWVAYDWPSHPQWSETEPPMLVTIEGQDQHYVVDRVFGSNTSGFYALGLLSDLYGPTLVVRGTDDLADLWDDTNPNGVGFAQFQSYWPQVSDWLDTLGVAVDFVGHSLGGALAQWFSTAFATGGGRIDQLVTFNSPGISQSVVAAFSPATAHKVTHYICNGDVVSMAGFAYVPGRVRMASFSDMNLINKHILPLVVPRVHERYRRADVSWKMFPTTEELSDAWFSYTDPDYNRWLVALNIGFHALAAASPVFSVLVPIPALLEHRGTTEVSRQLIGQGLREIEDVYEWTKDAAGRFVLHLKERAHDLYELMRPSVEADFQVTSDGGDPPVLRFDGGLAINVGDAISIDLPAWLGGPITAEHLIELVGVDVNGVMDRDHLQVNGRLSVLGDLVDVDGSAALDWSRGELTVGGTLDIGNGFITAAGEIRTGSRLDLVARGAASVNIPDAVPWIGGTSIVGGQYLLNYVNDLSPSNDFVAGWGSLGPIQLGLRVWFDGRWDLMGALELDSWAGGGNEGQGEGELPSSKSYLVAADTDWVLFLAEWKNASSTADFVLQTPSGLVLSQAEIEANPSMEIVDQLARGNRKAVLVRHPEQGVWALTISDTTGLGTVDLAALQSDPLPSVTVLGTEGGLLREPVQIRLEAHDPNSDARIALFYDTDQQGFDGVLIVDGLRETDGSTHYLWDTRGTTAGDYFIYASIIDDHNPPVLAYADLPVSITDLAGQENHAPSVANPLADQPAEENQLFSFTFAADTFRDDDVGDRLTFSATLANGDPLPVWLSLDDASCTLVGFPTLGTSGDVDILVTATDQGGLSAETGFTIHIAPDPDPWQNPGPDSNDRLDVNDDGVVDPTDVLIVINFINQHGARQLLRPSTPSEVEHLYIDVNGDNQCTPQDVLDLVNYLNTRLFSGEGEQISSLPQVSASACPPPAPAPIRIGPASDELSRDFLALPPSFVKIARREQPLAWNEKASLALPPPFVQIARDEQSAIGSDAIFAELDALLPELL